MECYDSLGDNFMNSKEKYVFYLRLNSFKPLDNDANISMANFTKPIYVPVALKFISDKYENDNEQISKKRRLQY